MTQRAWNGTQESWNLVSLPGIYTFPERENSVMETRVSETGETTPTITWKPTKGVRSSGYVLLNLLPIVLLVIGWISIMMAAWCVCLHVHFKFEIHSENYKKWLNANWKVWLFTLTFHDVCNLFFFSAVVICCNLLGNLL